MTSRVSDLTRPIDLRRRQRRRRRQILVAALVALVVLLGAGVWVVRWSSLLAVRTVTVEGISLLTVGQVREAGWIAEGTPLARVNVGAVASRVAELPAVQSVRVHRSWPDTIRIVVTERTPVYQVRDAGRYYWVDRTGTIFHVAGQVRPGLPQALADPGDKRLLGDLATTVASLSTTLRSQTDHLEATSPDAIVVVLSKDRRVVWGSADQSATKSTVATAMLGTPARTYDVSSPDHPTAR